MEARISAPGALVERFRARLGLTKVDLADAAGCSDTMIYNIERDISMPADELLTRLVAALRHTDLDAMRKAIGRL